MVRALGAASSLMLARARELRRDMTPAEWAMWRLLRWRSLGAKVRRQVPFGPYVLDFAIVDARLVIEVDGETHASTDGIRRDEARDAWLTSQGWRTLRFTNADVTTNPEDVPATIRQHARP